MLASLIATAPQLSAPDSAQKRLDDWLAGLDGSPHLWDLASADPSRLAVLLESDPEVRFDAILADTVAAISSTRDEAHVMQLLRRMKAEASLLIAIADIGGV